MSSSIQNTIENAGNHALSILDELVSTEAFELPLLPETATKLLGICNDVSSPPSQIADCIRRDQSIASHVLRMANSAMFMAGAPVVSLQQAVARLGIHRIRDIVMIVSCQSRVFDVEGFADYVRDSFRNSLAAAVFGQEIARARRLNVEDAFLCGLLHDIGRPVLLQAVVDYQKKNKVTLDRTELLGSIEVYRTSVGGRLIEKWKLPQRVADAVRNQHDDSAKESDAAAKILNLAISFTAAYGQAECELQPEPFLNHAMVEELNLYPDHVTAILSKSQEVLDLMGNV